MSFSPAKLSPRFECEAYRCQHTSQQFWHCVDCDSIFCRSVMTYCTAIRALIDDGSHCWSDQVPHRPDKRGREGLPHERSDPGLVRSLASVFDIPGRAIGSPTLCAGADHRKWLAIVKDTDRVFLEEYKQSPLPCGDVPKTSILDSTSQPQLVSIVGRHGAGKSTLINLLMQTVTCASEEDYAVAPTLSAPSRGYDGTVSVAGNVQMYRDFHTEHTARPILYAEHRFSDTLGPSAAPERCRGPDRIREIDWARKRSWQTPPPLETFFARVLCSLSRCLVFVHHDEDEPRSSLLSRLIKWGSAGSKGTVNQPRLPHCVVVLNRSAHLSESDCEVEATTEDLLTFFDAHSGSVPFHERSQSEQSARGRPCLGRSKELILEHYASFRAVRIPLKPRYEQIGRQTAVLRRLIETACQDTLPTGHGTDSVMDEEKFALCFDGALDHFAMHAFDAYDFAEAAPRRRSFSRTFHDHTLHLLTTISSRMRDGGADETRIIRMLENLGPVMSSCIRLDQERATRHGKRREDKEYLSSLEQAMEEFVQEHLVCPSRLAGNVQSVGGGHRGHLLRVHGDTARSSGIGGRETSVPEAWPRSWASQTLGRDARRMIQHEVEVRKSIGMPARHIAMDVHLDRLDSFFELVWPASHVRSNAICLACVVGMAEHTLQCGHMLCGACVRDCGREVGSTVDLRFCPMHRQATHWGVPSSVRFPPTGAQPRILVLPDCGVRGIVMLETLRLLEDHFQKLGGSLSIRACFDLIVGAGAGNFVAILAAQNRPSIAECCAIFQTVSHAVPCRTPLWGRTSRLEKAHKWHGLLKSAFQDTTLCPTDDDRSDFCTRVALACTDSAKDELVMLANYRRAEDVAPAYRFERPSIPEHEAKLWEIVACMLSTESWQMPGARYRQTLLGYDLTRLAERECSLTFPDSRGPGMLLFIGPGQSGTQERVGDVGHEHVSSKCEVHEYHVCVDPMLGSSAPPRHRFDLCGKLYRHLQDLSHGPAQAGEWSEIEPAPAVDVLTTVAYQLVASCFFLQLHACRRRSMSGLVLDGIIRCRFDEASEEMQALCSIISRHQTATFASYFTVQSQGQNARSMQFPARCEAGRIDPVPFSVPVAAETDAVVCRLIQSPYDKLSPKGYLVATSVLSCRRRSSCRTTGGSHSMTCAHSRNDVHERDEAVELPGTPLQSTPRRQEEEDELPPRDSDEEDLVEFAQDLFSSTLPTSRAHG